MPGRITCRECGQEKYDHGRGLCKSCKNRLLVEGVLDIKYPPWIRKGSKHEPSYRRFIPTKDALLDGHWEQRGMIQVWVWKDGKKPVDP